MGYESTAGAKKLGRKIFWPPGLREKRGDGLHGKEKPVRPVRERYEIKVPVKSRSLVVDRGDDDGNGRDLRGLDIGAMQRVHQKKLPYPLPPVSLIDGEAPEKRGRHQRIGWKSAGDRRGQGAWVHAERREPVIAQDDPGGVRCDGHERRCEGRRHLFGDSLLVAPRRLAQARPGSGRLQKRRDENLPVARAERHRLVVAHRTRRAVFRHFLRTHRGHG
jgi:hypothetical protein